tara:strand:- start:718 stop:1254 length:537 start_codon:yes stop_codon:yes gene_type:complete
MALVAKKAGMQVSGIEEFRDKLKPLPAKIQSDVALKAVRAASAEVRKKAQALVKSHALGEGLTPDGRTRNHLFKSITNRAKKYGKDKIPVGVVGTRYKESPHDHLVHDGTRPHVIPVPAPGLLGKLGRKFKVRHPGARGYPFMEIALERSRGIAQRVMIEKLQKEIAKELAKPSGGKK